MKDLVVPFRRGVFRHGRFPLGDLGDDFATKTLFIELERCFALAVEQKIRI